MARSSEDRFLASYDEHADAIFRFCYAKTGQRELALDLTQDTFVRVWRHLARGRSIDEMRPFLYTTARNAIIDHQRKIAPQSLDAMIQDGHEFVDPHSPDPQAVATTQHIISAIQNIEEPYREVVALRFLEQLLPREIAVIIGEKESVISTRITRGLAMLRQVLHL